MSSFGSNLRHTRILPASPKAYAIGMSLDEKIGADYIHSISNPIEPITVVPTPNQKVIITRNGRPDGGTFVANCRSEHNGRRCEFRGDVGRN